MDRTREDLHFYPVRSKSSFHASPAIRVETGACESEASRHPGFDTGWRVLPFVVVEVARGGQWIIETAADTIQVPEGTVFYLPATLRHRLRVERAQEMRSSWVYVEWRWGEVALPVPREVRLVRQPRIASAVRKLSKPPATATLPEQWQRQMLGMQLLEPLLAELEQWEPPDDRITRALEYGRQRLAEPLSRAELAAVAGLSETRFHDLCVAMTGLAPMQHVRKWRLQKATVLLLQTRESVGEIADRCGYESLFYFSRVFKATTGLSPVAFRSQATALR